MRRSDMIILKSIDSSTLKFVMDLSLVKSSQEMIFIGMDEVYELFIVRSMGMMVPISKVKPSARKRTLLLDVDKYGFAMYTVSRTSASTSSSSGHIPFRRLEHVNIQEARAVKQVLKDRVAGG